MEIRSALEDEYPAIGELMVECYSALDGFPNEAEQPAYYKTLRNIGEIAGKPAADLLVALIDNKLAGAVVYFSDMSQYGSGGTATREKNAAGFRLLAVDPKLRRAGAGKALSKACIERAANEKLAQVVIHSTKSMEVAWKMYEKVGFVRSPDLDFLQEELEVFGFRLWLEPIRKELL